MTTAAATTLGLKRSFQPSNLLLELTQQCIFRILVDLRLVLYVLGTISIPVTHMSNLLLNKVFADSNQRLTGHTLYYG